MIYGSRLLINLYYGFVNNHFLPFKIDFKVWKMFVKNKNKVYIFC